MQSKDFIIIVKQKHALKFENNFIWIGIILSGRAFVMQNSIHTSQVCKIKISLLTCGSSPNLTVVSFLLYMWSLQC